MSSLNCYEQQIYENHIFELRSAELPKKDHCSFLA